MKVLTHLCLSLLACLAASCSGDDRPADVQFLPFQLVATGVVPASAPFLPSNVTVISSASQLDQVRVGRFTVPPSLANFDFTQGDIVYVEALADFDPASVVRLLQVSRMNGADFVTAETCSSAAREPWPHRPYALYTMPKLLIIDSILMSLGSFDCASARRLQATVVASGGGSAFVDPPPTFIRDAASYAQVAQFAGLTAPPPDFTVSMLVMVTTLSDAGSLRFMGAYQSADGSRDLVTEFCGFTGHPDARPYLLVSIPASAVDPRIVRVTNTPPNCLTPEA